MNKITLIGRVATSPIYSVTKNQKSLTSFRIAVNRYGSDIADFFTINTWNVLAERCARYLVLGQQVGISGRCEIHEYDADGMRRNLIRVQADDVEFLAKPRILPFKNPDNLPEDPHEVQPVSEDELPF